MSRLLRRTMLAAALMVPCLTPVASAEDGSLYQRLGGYDAIAAVTDDFLAQLAADPEQSVYFVGLSNDSKARVRQNVVDFICQATGGPCLYDGLDIEVAHSGLGITDEQWQQAVVYLGETLNKLNVPEQEQKELVAVVATIKDYTVEKQ